MRIFLIQFLLLFQFNLMASEVIELTEPSNIRKSINFYGQKNIVGYLNTGSKVEILSKSKLQSGADAIEIKIIEPSNLVELNKTPPLYIWISKGHSPKPISETEAGLPCVDNSCQNQESKTKPTNELQNIVHQIEKQNNQESTENTSLDSQINNYANSPQVDKTIDFIENKKGTRNNKAKRRCYKAVKEALANQTYSGKGPGNNLIPKWFSSLSAKDGVKDLKKFGFINLLETESHKNLSAQTAPRGAVLVYKKPVHGHIEIKMDHGENSRFGYYTVKNHPINEGFRGKKYQLIGIMIKPLKEQQ